MYHGFFRKKSPKSRLFSSRITRIYCLKESSIVTSKERRNAFDDCSSHSTSYDYFDKNLLNWHHLSPGFQTERNTQLLRWEQRILPVKELISTAGTKMVGVDGISSSGSYESDTAPSRLISKQSSVLLVEFRERTDINIKEQHEQRAWTSNLRPSLLDENSTFPTDGILLMKLLYVARSRELKCFVKFLLYRPYCFEKHSKDRERCCIFL